MNPRSLPTYSYADQMGKILYLAMQEVLGSRAAGRIINIANVAALQGDSGQNGSGKQFRLPQVSRIQGVLEEAYGLQQSQGVALRCGRASFKYGLREFGEQGGWTDPEFRLLPMKSRMQLGTERMAEVLNGGGQTVRVSDQGDSFIWEIERCPVCWGRHASVVSCHLTVGLLQESLFWVSGGRYFDVRETQCIAKGDPSCTIVMDKRPLD